MCSYPTAYVQLTKKQQLLMVGQQYKMHLDLEMPESPANQNLGICANSYLQCFHVAYLQPILIQILTIN